ncbi:MAG: hypothetical protein CMI24_10390 [Opitutae bacterium]|nr:hypothetical protein [Opitutae bacterium]
MISFFLAQLRKGSQCRLNQELLSLKIFSIYKQTGLSNLMEKVLIGSKIRGFFLAGSLMMKIRA